MVTSPGAISIFGLYGHGKSVEGVAHVVTFLKDVDPYVSGSDLTHCGYSQKLWLLTFWILVVITRIGRPNDGFFDSVGAFEWSQRRVMRRHERNIGGTKDIENIMLFEEE
eukprot:678285_1